MIKVLLADDQLLLAQGLKSVLETSADITVCAIASDGEQAVELAKYHRPDVVLMDIRMPNMNGVLATKFIKEFDEKIKIIVLTTFDDSDYILGAINNGANGYLLKDIGAEMLIEAIKNAYLGDTILPAKIAKKIADTALGVTASKDVILKRDYGLSAREIEICNMLCDGFTNRQIASVLKLSDGTARNYISSIYIKLQTSSRIQAIDFLRSLKK